MNIDDLLTAEDLSKQEQSLIPITTLHGMFPLCEFDTPYQRGNDVWSKPMKVNLIESILYRIPIGTCHLVKQSTTQTRTTVRENIHIEVPEATIFNVLDGKQRLQCIRDFYNNIFAIKIENKLMKFGDIAKTKYYLPFVNYGVNVVQWEPMPLLKQRALFERINAMQNLKKNESLYCNNFFTKNLMDYIWNYCFNPLKKHLRAELSNNRRYSGYRWCNTVCYMCFGPTFTDKFGYRKIVAEEAIKELDNKILQYLEKNSKITDDQKSFVTEIMLDDLKIKKNIETLKRTCHVVSDVLDFKHEIGKILEQNTLKDILAFLVKKQQEEVLTISQIRENMDKMYSVILEFYKRIDKQNLKSNQDNTGTIEDRFTILEELLASNFDLSKKNRDIPSISKTIAKLESDGRCTMCGIKLNEENCQIDHKQPKSKYGASDYDLKCNNCNRIKSNLSVSQCEKIIFNQSESNSLGVKMVFNQSTPIPSDARLKP